VNERERIKTIWKEAKEMDVALVVRKYEKYLRRLPYVIGIDSVEKEGKEIIKVIVLQKMPLSNLEPEDIIPKELDGYEISVEEMSAITEQSTY
jgi:hypothetical protein